jgi:hypothetical protein
VGTELPVAVCVEPEFERSVAVPAASRSSSEADPHKQSKGET